MRDNLNGIQPSKGSTYCVLGNLYTFRAIGKDTGEAYALFELLVQPHHSLPLHAHSLEDEAFYILDGKVEFQIEEQTFVATSGTFLHCSKGQLHRFTNIERRQPKCCLGYTRRPGGFSRRSRST